MTSAGFASPEAWNRRSESPDTKRLDALHENAKAMSFYAKHLPTCDVESDAKCACGLSQLETAIADAASGGEPDDSDVIRRYDEAVGTKPDHDTVRRIRELVAPPAPSPTEPDREKLILDYGYAAIKYGASKDIDPGNESAYKARLDAARDAVLAAVRRQPVPVSPSEAPARTLAMFSARALRILNYHAPRVSAVLDQHLRWDDARSAHGVIVGFLGDLVAAAPSSPSTAQGQEDRR